MKKDMKTINEIIKVVGESQLTELAIEEKEFKLFIKKPKLVIENNTEEIEESNKLESKSEELNSDNLDTESEKEIISEMVGKFYFVDRDGEPMIKVGMPISKGQEIGYVMSIGIRNDIKSEFDGVVKEILLENGEVAEYGKVLVKIEE